MAAFTREQWLTIGTFVIVNFCNALCASMQAPFYPREAAKKGLEVWAFGLVFGVFEITVFVVSPFIGLGINRFGVKRTLNVGIGLVGLVLVAYGCLGQLSSGPAFLGCSMVLRTLEACGNSAFLTGSFSAIAREFPNNVASMFAVIELFFGIGQIVGPLLGGALYQVGGFTLPFAIMGSLLFISSIFIYFVLPEIQNPPSDLVESPKPTMRMALSKPSICIALFKVSTAACSIGFLQTTLEPHLASISSFTSFQVGAFFMVLGGAYGLSLPVWGSLGDSKLTRNSPKLVEVTGAVLIIAGFLIMGPFKYLPITKSVPSIIVGMSLHGFGLGASLVGGFSDAHKSAVASGLPDNLDTYGLVSGLWTSVFAFGAFVGPTAGGFLYDAVTFRWAIFLVVGLEAAALALLIAYLALGCRGQVFGGYQQLESGGKEEEEKSVEEVEGASYGTAAAAAPKGRTFSSNIGASYAAARSMSHGSSLASGSAGAGGPSLARLGEHRPLL